MRVKVRLVLPSGKALYRKGKLWLFVWRIKMLKMRLNTLRELNKVMDELSKF